MSDAVVAVDNNISDNKSLPLSQSDGSEDRHHVDINDDDFIEFNDFDYDMGEYDSTLLNADIAIGWGDGFEHVPMSTNALVRTPLEAHMAEEFETNYSHANIESDHLIDVLNQPPLGQDDRDTLPLKATPSLQFPIVLKPIQEKLSSVIDIDSVDDDIVPSSTQINNSSSPEGVTQSNIKDPRTKTGRIPLLQPPPDIAAMLEERFGPEIMTPSPQDDSSSDLFHADFDTPTEDLFTLIALQSETKNIRLERLRRQLANQTKPQIPMWTSEEYIERIQTKVDKIKAKMNNDNNTRRPVPSPLPFVPLYKDGDPELTQKIDIGTTTSDSID